MHTTTTPTAVLGFVFGGVFLLLYGVRLISEVMQRDAKVYMQRWLMVLSKYPPAAFCAGVGVTMLTQSSSLTSSLLVNLVSVRFLQLPMAIIILLGTKVGSALTVQLLTFHITDYAFLLVGAGAACALFTSRGQYKGFGQACLGFGLVFLGLAALEAGSSPLAESSITVQLFTELAKSPLVLALMGMILTMLFSSSIAGIGLVIVLASHDALPLVAAIPLVLGANVGSTTSALFSAFSQGAITGKRLAFVHTGTSLAGALLALLLLSPIVGILSLLHLPLTATVAISHLAFNLLLALIFIPITPQITRLIEKIIPEPQKTEQIQVCLLNVMEISAPSLALGQVTREILHMVDIVAEMLQISIDAFGKRKTEIIQRIDQLDDRLDNLNSIIKHYLMRLDEEQMSEDEKRRQIAFLYIISDLEAMGDVIDKQWMRLARRKQRKQIVFSQAEWQDLVDYHQAIVSAVQNLFAGMASQDPVLIRAFLTQKHELSTTKQMLQLKHLRRLQQDDQFSVRASEIHLDVLASMRSVLSYPATIAHVMQDQIVSQADHPDLPVYSTSIKV